VAPVNAFLTSYESFPERYHLDFDLCYFNLTSSADFAGTNGPSQTHLSPSYQHVSVELKVSSRHYLRESPVPPYEPELGRVVRRPRPNVASD
jgi:hypothetical protein